MNFVSVWKIRFQDATSTHSKTFQTYHIRISSDTRESLVDGGHPKVVILDHTNCLFPNTPWIIGLYHLWFTFKFARITYGTNPVINFINVVHNKVFKVVYFKVQVQNSKVVVRGYNLFGKELSINAQFIYISRYWYLELTSPRVKLQNIGTKIIPFGGFIFVCTTLHFF